jgi:glycosyltransferase involved in cell wall biosynthesis
MTTVPKRILMTADTVAGVWTYALELARALGNYDIDVAIATMGPEPSRLQCEEASAIRNVDLFKSDYKLEWMEDSRSHVRAAGEWLLGLEKRLQPDVVHLNGYAHAALPWKSPKLVVAHSCLYSWWNAIRQGDPPPEWKQYKTAVVRGLRAADLVVAPTQAMLNTLDDNYPGAIKSDARVIPNGLDVDAFSPVLEQKFVFTAGRLWDEAKNMRTLTGVAWQLSWPLCLAGEKRSADSGVAFELKEN